MGKSTSVRALPRRGLLIGQTHDGRPVRSLTTAVFAQLRAEILSCRLKPGEKLLIAGLARRFAVSLSAVREALSRLAAEGLVTSEDQRGFHVSPVSAAQLRDLTRTRIDIEGLALRRAIERGDSQWQAQVREAYERLAAAPLPRAGDAGPNFERWRALHRRFHLALVSACGSAWLLRLRETLDDQSERYRFLAHGVRARDVEAEHAAILRAVLDRDVDGAVKALGEHFALTAEIITASRWGEERADD